MYTFNGQVGPITRKLRAMIGLHDSSDEPSWVDIFCYQRAEREVNHIQGGGGRKRLPKFKFSAKFPIGLQVILQIQIKNSKMTAILCEKLF